MVIFASLCICLPLHALRFDPFDNDLPVRDIIHEVRAELNGANALIVNAPPGAGKSTLLPLALLDEPWLEGKKIILLEPRRLAARAIAQRMSEMLHEEVGETVGYRIRFDTKISSKTKLEVVTEGILTRMLQSDNALEAYALVIFDEFHERSLHADLALALCREAQQILRPDLRLMIMSATLDHEKLSALLNCKAIRSSGKQFPVEIIYGEDAAVEVLPELCARKIIDAASEMPGDLLVFLPGEVEIRKCEEILHNAGVSFSVHPLYGMLPQREQIAAILPRKDGNRKVVLATSIAETSLTIEGIKIVIDSGFARTSRFDPRSGLSRLETVRVTKDAADQRAGRAGRLSEGICYRMWTPATHSRLQAGRIPEIEESDLCALLLELFQWGITDVSSLSWLSSPPKAAVAQAKEVLETIDAVSQNKITEHGKQIHRLACHPRIAHMLLKAENEEMKHLGCDLAALLEERDPLPKESGADINLRIEAMRRWRALNNTAGKFSRIDKIAGSYRKMLHLQETNGSHDPYTTGLLLAYAFPERIASARPGNNAQFQLSNGKIAALGHKDDLSGESWIAVANMDAREGLGKIFLAAPLNPKDLIALVREEDTVSWNTHKGGLNAAKELKIGKLVLQSKPLLQVPKEKIVDAISKALETEAGNLLDLSKDFLQLQHRIDSLKCWNTTQSWPEVSNAYLFGNAGAWLGPYLENIRKVEELKKINLQEALFHSLTYDQQRDLEKLAPSKVIVPSGSKIHLEYFPGGKTPVLAVRLQEVFGLKDTPKVNGDKIPVVMHLLSPGYKPVQVTSDLKSFWTNLYFEVKKELQRRYPKHSWPEDPLVAPAVAKGRSHK